MRDPDRDHAQEALAPTCAQCLRSIHPDQQNWIACQRNAGALSPPCSWLPWIKPIPLLYPTTRARHASSSRRPASAEKNVWLALKRLYTKWPASVLRCDEIPLTRWPELPPRKWRGLSVRRPLRELVDHLKKRRSASTSGGRLPWEPYRAPTRHIGVSRLCGGWLWGPAATAPFKAFCVAVATIGPAYAALHAACYHLRWCLSPRTFPGLVGEAEAGFLMSALLAAGGAGFALEGVALRAEKWPGLPGMAARCRS